MSGTLSLYADRIRPILDYVKTKVDSGENRYNSGEPNFQPGGTVAASVRAFREWMGPRTGGEIGHAELSRWLRDQHDGEGPSRQTVMRWETGIEPDLRSVWLMARRARVSMEDFCGFNASTNVGGTIHFPADAADEIVVKTVESGQQTRPKKRRAGGRRRR